MPFCPECSATVAADSPACPTCGAALVATPTRSGEPAEGPAPDPERLRADLADSLANLADLLRRTARPAEAERLEARAAALRR